MIELVEATIRSGPFTLARLSGTVPAGAYGVPTGRTGCGKTTALKTIAGLHQSDSGKIELFGNTVVDGRFKSEFVGFAVRHAAANAAAGHPHRKAVMIVVAAVAVFRSRRAAELASPNNQRVLQQTALL